LGAKSTCIGVHPQGSGYRPEPFHQLPTNPCTTEYRASFSVFSIGATSTSAPPKHRATKQKKKTGKTALLMVMKLFVMDIQNLPNPKRKCITASLMQKKRGGARSTKEAWPEFKRTFKRFNNVSLSFFYP
jgi:hypothetical protein